MVNLDGIALGCRGIDNDFFHVIHIVVSRRGCIGRILSIQLIGIVGVFISRICYSKVEIINKHRLGRIELRFHRRSRGISPHDCCNKRFVSCGSYLQAVSLAFRQRLFLNKRRIISIGDDLGCRLGVEQPPPVHIIRAIVGAALVSCVNCQCLECG